METQSALVGADGVVELETVAGVDLDFAAVVDPYHLEGETAVGLYDAFRNAVGFEFGVLVIGLLHGHEDLAHGLQVLAFARMLALALRHQFVDVHTMKFFIVGLFCFICLQI